MNRRERRRQERMGERRSVDLAGRRDSDSQMPQPHMQVQTTHQTYSGPIPSPEALTGYAKIQPDLVNRIVMMAEREQQERHPLQRSMVRNDFVQVLFSTTCALVVALAGISGAIYLGMHDKPHAAVAVALNGTAGIVGSFLYRRHRVKEQHPDAKHGGA